MKDRSLEIFEKYYNLNRIVEITLKYNSVLIGTLSSFIHGDENTGTIYN
jgi:small nuclear ribonucleoprotein (snRNP)-like protein